MRYSLTRYIRYQYYKMIRVKDTPSKVARGVGLGFALDFAIPVPLVSIFIAFIVARILKFNSLAAVIAGTAIKPFFPAVVMLNIYTQMVTVRIFPGISRVIVAPHPSAATLFEKLVNSVFSRGVPYLLAGVINGIIVFIVSYFVVHYLLRARINKTKKRR